jgi:hypothetical protein
VSEESLSKNQVETVKLHKGIENGGEETNKKQNLCVDMQQLS